MKKYLVTVNYQAIVTTDDPDFAMEKALDFDGIITELMGHGDVIEWEDE